MARRLHRYRARDPVADVPDVEAGRRRGELHEAAEARARAEVVVKTTPQAKRDPLVILYVGAKQKCNQKFGDGILDHACAVNTMTRPAEQVCSKDDGLEGMHSMEDAIAAELGVSLPSRKIQKGPLKRPAAKAAVIV